MSCANCGAPIGKIRYSTEKGDKCCSSDCADELNDCDRDMEAMSHGTGIPAIMDDGFTECKPVWSRQG